MKVFAFVFARGGSKGLPGKNIRVLGNKPLLAWSIDTARSVDRIDEVFVSTDSVDIQNVARKYEAIVIERPPELASDVSPEWLSWQHAVKWAQQYYGSFDLFISLPATAPLRSNKDVEDCMDAMRDGIDVVVTMVDSHRNPWFNMVKRDSGGTVETVNKSDGSIVRRQDAPQTFDLTTVAYVARPQFVLESYSIWDGKVGAVEVPRERAVDIDTIEDFRYVEFLLMNKAESE